MKASLLVLALTIAAFQATPPSPQAGPPDIAQCNCSIEVTVEQLSTGEPIPDVEVSVGLPPTTRSFQTAGAAAGSNSVSIKTDSNGRAVFHNLAEATYSVTAQREGYFGSASSNDTYPPQASSSMSIRSANQADAREAPEQPVQQITLNMVHGVTISGRVYDASHRPAATAPVGAYQVTYKDGYRVLTQTGSTVQSTDRGDYRLFGLPPGEYYIRAGSAGSIGPSGGFRGQAGQRGFDPTANRSTGRGNYPNISFYPGTTDAKAAIQIILRDGESRSGIDLALQPAATATISGTIVNTILGGGVEPEVLATQPFLPSYLVPRDPYFLEAPILFSSPARARGLRGDNPSNGAESPFEIHEVPPGTYDLYAVYTDTTNTGNVAVNRFSARTSIEVRTEDVTGVRAVIRPGTNLNGHVTFIGAPPLALTSIRVLLRPKGNMPTLVTAGVAAPVGADGGFTIANLIDAPYFVAGISSLPDDAYVSDIRQDARNVFDENIITIGKDAQTTLEVVVSRGGATLQGTVQDAKHNPASAARITLIPDMPRRKNVLLYKTATSDAIGSFKLSGLAPGTYTLFAWEHIPNGAEQNEDFIHDYEALGVRVIVSSRLPLTNIQLPLIPKKR